MRPSTGAVRSITVYRGNSTKCENIYTNKRT